MSEPCVLCGDPVKRGQQQSRVHSPIHRECNLREVLGGIGHLLAHGYWCLELHDPDAGLTYRQSALMVAALVDLLGVEAVVRRSPA